jgi:hypothetical protein
LESLLGSEIWTMWADLQQYVCPRRRREILEQLEAMTWNLLEDFRDHLRRPEGQLERRAN